MADDTTGFRSLVEQIQMRDKTPVSPRESARDRAAQPVEMRTPRKPARAAETRERAPRDERWDTFLSHRWL